VIQQTNGDNVEANWHRSENNKKLRLEQFVCSVGENLNTTIHVINCFSEKKTG